MQARPRPARQEKVQRVATLGLKLAQKFFAAVVKAHGVSAAQRRHCERRVISNPPDAGSSRRAVRYKPKTWPHRNPQDCGRTKNFWCIRRDSNPQPSDPK